MKAMRMARMKMPRRGSVAKVCTEVSTPDRTRKVPISESEKARIASRIDQTLSAPRFSITAAEWKSEQLRAIQFSLADSCQNVRLFSVYHQVHERRYFPRCP